MVDVLLDGVSQAHATLATPGAGRLLADAGPALFVLLALAGHLIATAALAPFEGAAWLARFALRTRANAQSREEAAMLRGRSGPGFAVLVAPLRHDRDQLLGAVLERALDIHAKRFLFDRAVVRGRLAAPLDGPEAADAARRWLALSDADVVVWGAGSDGRRLMRLFCATARGEEDGAPVQELRIAPPATAADADRVAQAVAYVMARAAAPCADEPDRYRVDKLAGVLEAMGDLAERPPAELGPRLGEALREDAARLALSIGERAGDADVLRQALELRTAQLNVIDPVAAPADWARARASAGRAMAALGHAAGELSKVAAGARALAEAAERLGEAGEIEECAEVLARRAGVLTLGADLDPSRRAYTEAGEAIAAALEERDSLRAASVHALRRDAAHCAVRIADLEDQPATRERAATALKRAVCDPARRLDANGWSEDQDQLGRLLCRMAEAAEEDDAPALWREAVVAFTAALEERPQSGDVGVWGDTTAGLAAAYYGVGKSSADARAFASAADAYSDALAVADATTDPLLIAQLNNNMGNALQALGEATGSGPAFEGAVKAYDAAAAVLSVDDQPAEWAGTLNNLGNTLLELGERTGMRRHLEDALAAHQAALSVRSRETDGLDWAASQNNIGLVHAAIGGGARDPEHIHAAIDAYRAALDVFRMNGATRWAVTTERNLERAQGMLSDWRSAAH